MCNCLCSKSRADKDIANYDYLLFEYNKFPAMAREVLLPELADIMRTINKKITAKTAAIRAQHALERERDMRENAGFAEGSSIEDLQRPSQGANGQS